MMEKYKVFEPVNPAQFDLRRNRPLRLKFIYEWKLIEENGVTRVGIKARLVAEGMKRFDHREGVDVSTGMPKARAFTMLCAWVASQPGYTKEACAAGDVRNAFLQSKLQVPVLVKAPKDAPEMFGPGGLALAVQAIYGTREAPRAWEIHLVDNVVVPLKFVRSRCHPGVYLRYGTRVDPTTGERSEYVDAALYVHVDDLFAFSVPSALRIIEEIKQEFDSLSFTCSLVT